MALFCGFFGIFVDLACLIWVYGKLIKNEKGCDHMEMTLGGRIQTLRKQRGITQEELAKAMQVSTQAVSKCTKGAQSGNALEHRMPCCYRG